MPVIEVQDARGRTLQIDGDAMPSEAELDGMFEQAYPATPSEKTAVPAPGYVPSVRSSRVASTVLGAPAPREEAIRQEIADQPMLREQAAMQPTVQLGQPATIPRFGEPGTMSRGISEIISGLGEFALNRPEEVAASLYPPTAAAIALRYTPEIGKQWLEDVYKGFKGDKEAAGRASAMLFAVGGPVAVKRGIGAVKSANADIAYQAQYRALVDRMAREGLSQTVGERQTPFSQISMEPAPGRDVLVPKARDLTEEEAQRLILSPEQHRTEAELAAAERPALLPESAAELKKFTGGTETVEKPQAPVGKVEPAGAPVEKPAPTPPTVSEGTPPAEAPEAPSVTPGRNWDLFYEDLVGNLDSFSPARTTGKRNYALDDMAERFVSFAKEDKSGKSLVDLVSDFAESDEATTSQIKKLKLALKSLSEETKPAAAPEPSATGFPEAFTDIRATDDLYRKIFDAAKAGKTTVAGVKDPLLAESGQLIRSGKIASPEALKDWVQSGKPAAPAEPTTAELAGFRDRLRSKQDQVIAIAERLGMDKSIPISDVQIDAPSINDLKSSIFPEFESSIDAFLANHPEQAEATPAPAQAAAKVEAEVKAVARTEGQRPAKEVKNELVDRLKRAIDVAPTESEVRAKSYTTVQGKTVSTPDQAETVTIDIPGDGVFTIRNTKEALEGILKRAKKISTTSTEPKPRIPKGAVQSSEKALGEMEKAKATELQKNVKINHEKARTSLYDAINESESEGIVGSSKPQEDPETYPEGTMWKEWRIRKATPEERTQHWKGTKAEIRWVGERRTVKFSKEKGRTENEWLFDDSGKTRADVIRGMEANMPQDATLQDPGLKNWRDLEKMEGGYSFLKEGKTEPPAQGPGTAGPGISNGPGAASYGFGKYPPIAELTDQMATSPVKNVREAIGVGERLSDAWAKGKDAVTRTIGKLSVVPSALKRAWKGIRDFNQVEERVKSLDWPLQQSAGLSKRAGEEIKRAIPASQVRDGMAIWIDAAGDEPAIRNALASLPANTKPRIRRALEAALNLSPEVKTHASNLSYYYAKRAAEAQAEDVLHSVLEDYFTHIWKKPANMPDSVKAALNSGRVDEYFRYSQKRKIPTFLEGILQGKEPVLDPAEVIPHYNYLMDRAIASRRFIKQLEDATMPDGKPVLGPWGTRATIGNPGDQAILIKIRGKPEDYNDYRQIDHPALRKWKWAATDEQGRPVFYEGTLAVHPDAYERLARMMDRSRLSPTAFVRGALRVSGEVKGAKLGLLSPFHQVHLGSHALGHWTNPFFNLPEIDWESPKTQFAIEKGGLKLAANPAEMASFAEGILGRGLVHKIPAIGPISKAYSEWLFTDYLPRLKLKTFENAWQRNRAFYAKDIASGKITEEQLAARVGDSINNAYGELNQLWLGKHGRDPRFQRALRLGFLAPDFGEGRLRFVAKAGTKYGLEERLALGTLFTTLYVGARLGNLLTHGDAEIEDWKHAFSVKVGNRWYSMRSVLGDTLHAFTNFPNFIYNRLNPLYTRSVMEQFTGRDISGRKRDFGEKMLDIAKQVVPIHLSGLMRDDQHVWESFLQAIGVGSQRAAPTAEVSNLAADWKKKRGIEEGTEILSDRDSPYRKARLALEFGNRDDFREAVSEMVHQRQLRGDRTPRKSVQQAFERYYTQPFTGSTRMEPAFKASLGPRERKKYSDALAERRKLLQQFRQWF